MNVVHWSNVVKADFLDRFKEIAKAEYFAGLKDLSTDTLHKKFGEDMEEYAKYRAFLRSHGWFKSYLDNGELHFTSIYPIDRKYISLSQYLTARDAQRMADDEEEYYSVKDAVKTAMPKPRKDIDGDDDFVPEIEVTP